MTDPYYRDDWITLYHGRNVEHRDHWLTADVLVTDPPYGIDYSSGWDSSIPSGIANDTDTTHRDTALASWANRPGRPNGPALVFGTWRSPRPAATHTRLIWDTKGALGMGNLSVPWKPSDQEIYVIGYGFHGPRTTNVISCPPVQSMAKNGRTHPHEKPVALLTALLLKCPPGIVADPFAGTGSTLIAAKALGCQAIGVELDERYCETAAQRLSQDAFDFAAGTTP